MRFRSYAFAALLSILAASLFTGAGIALRKEKRVDASPEISVSIPLFVQVVMAGGDRFLAANLASVRALITDASKLQLEDYAILARLHVDASWLNPAHEDNYYTASATLPWFNQIDAAQTVLRRAATARFYDYQPAFYYAFNLVYFKNDPVGASAFLRERAPFLKLDEDRLMLESFAARWLDHANDLKLAIAVLESMASQAKRKDFQRYLRARAVRLKGLLALRTAASAFFDQRGRKAASLDELVSAGFVSALPVDPFGVGYRLDTDKTPILGGDRYDAFGNKY